MCVVRQLVKTTTAAVVLRQSGLALWRLTQAAPAAGARKRLKDYLWCLTVIFMSSYWLHFWSTMLPQEEQDTMRNGATLLKSVAKGLLFHYGWRSSIRIAS
uniref:Uncharacterized protein n=1 Tax=Oryza barthii TaxID=65489 RepID=A0A0D3FK45_9ORYZ